MVGHLAVKKARLKRVRELLTELQGEIHDSAHDLVNVIAALTGEIDLAIERARAKLKALNGKIAQEEANDAAATSSEKSKGD
jgi:hypothetical protein